jgi:hypothetical protein
MSPSTAGISGLAEGLDATDSHTVSVASRNLFKVKKTVCRLGSTGWLNTVLLAKLQTILTHFVNFYTFDSIS